MAARRPRQARATAPIQTAPAAPPPIGHNSGARRGVPTSEFMRDLSTGQMAGFRVALREPADEHRQAWYDATARTIESIHNSGWLSGGIDQATNAICGPMLALNARPDPKLMGGPDNAQTWARDVERRFSAWAVSAYACDIYARNNLGQLCSQAQKHWFATGEIVGVVRYKKRPGNTHGTKLMMLPSKRIPQYARNKDAVQGLILDADGAPIRACFETIDPRNPWVVDEIEVPFRDTLGRPQVILIHDSPATVVRGITPLAPVIRVIRQCDQLFNATLTQALVQALFAATITSDAPDEDMFAAIQGADEQLTSPVPAGTVDEGGNFARLMRMRADWYRNTRLDLGTVGKLVHLFPGEKLEFKGSESPNSNFKDFCRFLLREIARCIGITYEQLTGDREGATYSSERMGGAEQWLQTLYRRTHIAGKFMQMAYEAWLEEDIELGNTPFPGGLDGFLANRDLASRADWRGPPKPTADDLKTAKANEVKKANGILTKEAWCAEEGTDWEDVDDQRLREQQNEKRLNLDPPLPGPAGQPGQGTVTPQGGSKPPGATKDDRLVQALIDDDHAAVDAILTE
jgi:lambda family phage portal protein